MKKKYDTGEKIGITFAVLIGLYVLMCVFGGFPIPRGARVDIADAIFRATSSLDDLIFFI